MKEKVYIKKVNGYQDAVEVVEDMFCQLESTKQINENTKIILKPNLLAKHIPEHAVTTHPEILRGAIKACLSRGAKRENILVLDSAGGIYNPGQMKSLYQVCGLTKVCNEEGVALYTLCQSTTIDIDGQVAKQFDIINPVLQADYIINLPKMKTHVMTGMSAACKNMFGIIPGLKKSEWHMRFPDKERFGHMIVDLLEAIPPNIAIVDGILAMEGDGPAGGNPRNVGIVMASENMFQLDLAIASMMNLNAMRVPYLKAANSRNLCSESFDKKDIVGDETLLEPISNWKLPESYTGKNNANTDFAAFVPSFIRPIVKKIEHTIAPHPVIDKKRCIGCGKCKEICSKDAIIIKDKKAKIIRKQCIHCFCCHEVCPVKAIEVKKLEIFKL